MTCECAVAWLPPYPSLALPGDPSASPTSLGDRRQARRKPPCEQAETAVAADDVRDAKIFGAPRLYATGEDDAPREFAKEVKNSLAVSYIVCPSVPAP